MSWNMRGFQRTPNRLTGWMAVFFTLLLLAGCGPEGAADLTEQLPGGGSSGGTAGGGTGTQDPTGEDEPYDTGNLKLKTMFIEEDSANKVAFSGRIVNKGDKIAHTMHISFSLFDSDGTILESFRSYPMSAEVFTVSHSGAEEFVLRPEEEGVYRARSHIPWVDYKTYNYLYAYQIFNDEGGVERAPTYIELKSGPTEYKYNFGPSELVAVTGAGEIVGTDSIFYPIYYFTKWNKDGGINHVYVVPGEKIFASEIETVGVVTEHPWSVYAGVFEWELYIKYAYSGPTRKNNQNFQPKPLFETTYIADESLLGIYESDSRYYENEPAYDDENDEWEDDTYEEGDEYEENDEGEDDYQDE